MSAKRGLYVTNFSKSEIGHDLDNLTVYLWLNFGFYNSKITRQEDEKTLQNIDFVGFVFWT
jgi:hypothetical protein